MELFQPAESIQYIPSSTQRIQKHLRVTVTNFAMEDFHILDFHLHFAFQSIKNDYRFERKNYFWEVGNTHKYSAEVLKLRISRFSRAGTASRQLDETQVQGAIRQHHIKNGSPGSSKLSQCYFPEFTFSLAGLRQDSPSQ